jgi:hypothetical protein
VKVLAAGVALQGDDPVPLLRLGAEGFFTLTGDSGDPTGFSAGVFYATGCSDVGECGSGLIRSRKGLTRTFGFAVP